MEQVERNSVPQTSCSTFYTIVVYQNVIYPIFQMQMILITWKILRLQDFERFCTIYRDILQDLGKRY